MPQVSVRMEGAEDFGRLVQTWNSNVRRDVRSALNKIGTAWVTEAKKRVPVEFGVLRNSINKQVSVTRDNFELAVGTHVKYGVYTEFGTRHIAGGRVKALGDGPAITDAQAIKDWPAKTADNAQREQMPWLRPSFNFLREKILQQLQRAFAIPRTGRR